MKRRVVYNAIPSHATSVASHHSPNTLRRVALQEAARLKAEADSAALLAQEKAMLVRLMIVDNTWVICAAFQET